MREIKVGNYYILNEDIKNLWTLKESVDTTPIKAGAKCKVIELNGEYVTLEFETGQKVRTETHMIV